MTERDEICAIVPMRGESERVPGKNYRPFGGSPLFHHIIGTVLRAGEIDRVVVDTDSRIIMEDCSKNFPMVHVIERPEELRGGSVPMTEVLRHDAERIEAPVIFQTHSTNPLLRRGTISKAINAFYAAGEAFDSLFSVTALHSRLYDSGGRPLNHDPNELVRTQDLPPILEENSNIYIFRRELVLERGARIGDRPYMFQMDALEAVDIDEERDFELAELVYEGGLVSSE